MTDTLKLATEVWQTSHWTSEQLKRLKRFAELVAAQEREAFKNAVYVAITMLFDSHRDDVARTFSIAELQRIADHTDALGNEQVENIYRAAFDKFDAARAKEQTP